MKEPRNSMYPSGLLTADTFIATFQDFSVTLMPPDTLRRELALLRKACAPAPDEPIPPPPEDPPSFEEVRDLAFQLLYDTLLDETPNADTVHAALASVPVDQTLLLQELIDLAQTHLRTARRHAPLFLVPTAWHVRMADILYGNLYPARVRHWDVDDADSHCFP